MSMNTAEPIRDKTKLKAMTEYCMNRGQIRNYALIIVGVHTALRISDLLSLRWEDVSDAEKIRPQITVFERKTKKTKVIALHTTAIDALKLLYTFSGYPDDSRYIFENRRTKQAISRIQAYRIIKDVAAAVVLEGTISCHSLRKSFGYHAWKENVPLAVIMEIYNHSSYAVTRRYLGITQDDKNNAYLSVSMV